MLLEKTITHKTCMETATCLLYDCTLTESLEKASEPKNGKRERAWTHMILVEASPLTEMCSLRRKSVQAARFCLSGGTRSMARCSILPKQRKTGREPKVIPDLWSGCLKKTSCSLVFKSNKVFPWGRQCFSGETEGNLDPQQGLVTDLSGPEGVAKTIKSFSNSLLF